MSSLLQVAARPSPSAVETVLLIINRAAGTGYAGTIGDRLRAILSDHLPAATACQVELVNDHATAREQAQRFLATTTKPAAIIAGGGGGTLRAVIEGICAGSAPGRLPDATRVRVAALRMGSGNVVAKQFGVPKDPVVGLPGILKNLQAGRTVPGCIMRCEVGQAAGEPEIHYAATLGGFGQFGRVPGDLARWHERWPWLHKAAARFAGIENLTNLEYALAMLVRSAVCALRPQTAETVTVRVQPETETLHLYAGLAMNFPFKALPFKPGVTIADEALAVFLIPYPGRGRTFWPVLAPQRLKASFRLIKLGPTDWLDLELVDRDQAEFFLDEDPMIFHRRLRLQVAGTLAFVPGPDYPAAPESEVDDGTSRLGVRN